MKPKATPTKVRKPIRGGALLEFIFGLVGGILASFFVSLAYQVYSPSNGYRTPSASSLNPLTVASPSGLGESDSRPQVPRDAEWSPKARLPGYKDPKIACIVTQDSQFNLLPDVVNVTWGSRCDHLIFAAPRLGIDDSLLKKFNTVSVEKDGTSDSTWKTYRSLIANVDVKDADYILFVNDQTYAIPDNVRYEFRGFNPGDEPLFWGRMQPSITPLSLMSSKTCMSNFFVLSRVTLQALKKAIASNTEACISSKGQAASSLNACLAAVGVQCREAIDFQGKWQIMDDPIKALSQAEIPAHLLKGPECCSVLPLAFLNVAKTVNIRTGTFSYHYFYDYFIRDTAVFGREFMRPLNGIDAGVGKPQIGF